MGDVRAKHPAWYASVSRLHHFRMLRPYPWTATDAQIDRLVYALYGLTDEEIKVVEG